MLTKDVLYRKLQESFFCLFNKMKIKHKPSKGTRFSSATGSNGKVSLSHGLEILIKQNKEITFM